MAEFTDWSKVRNELIEVLRMRTESFGLDLSNAGITQLRPLPLPYRNTMENKTAPKRSSTLATPNPV